MNRLTVIGALAGAVFGVGAAAHADFAPGDLYLVSNCLFDPDFFCMPGMVHVDPQTGDVEVFPMKSSMSADATTYDPFRDRIVTRFGAAGSDLRLIDSVGGVTPLPHTFAIQVRAMAPTGDGRLYLLGNQGMGYIDAAGQTHTVFEADGITPFNPNLPAGLGRIIYESNLNALFIADIMGADTRLRRLPLNEDGARVVGPIDSMTLVGSDASSESVVGMGAGPNGMLFIKFDDNSNTLQPRMQLVDPVQMTSTTFASSEYFGVGGEVAGCYSAVRDQAVVLDSLSDTLRVFSQGSAGEGMIFVEGTVSDMGGSGELAMLLEIGGTIGGMSPDIQPADLNGDRMVNAADLAILLGAWSIPPGAPGCGGAMPCPADLNNDGFVNAADLAILLGAWTL